MAAALGVDELNVHPHVSAAALDASFQHVAHVQFTAERPHVDRNALEGESGAARDDESVANPRQVCRQALRYAIDEILLFRIAPDVGEGHNDHGEARRRGGFFVRQGRRGLRSGGVADINRIDADRFGDVLELGQAEIGHGELEPPLDLPIGLFGKTDRSGLGDAFETRGDIDAVAHQVAVALLDHIGDVDTDPKHDLTVLGHSGVAPDHRVLHFDGAPDGVDCAAELDDVSVAGALDDAAVMHRDRGVDEIASQRPQPSQNAIFIDADEPAEADHIRA